MLEPTILASLAVAGVGAAASASPLDSGPTLLTPDQQRVDVAAQAIVSDPQLIAAKQKILEHWASQPPATLRDGKAALPATIDELAYLVALTIAQQVLVPDTIISIETAPGVWDENTPGSRWALDNPDRIYRLATVDPSASYIVTGQRQPNPSNGDYRFEATADGVTTLAGLDGPDITVAADGSFQFVMDATPTNGRRDHLSLPPGADTIVIRDTLSDWAQRPNRLAIRRIGAPTQPGTMDEAVRRSVALLHKYAELDLGWITSFGKQPVNQLIARARSSENGLGGTINAASRFSLRDDEALVITVDPQGAGYTSLLLTNPWAVSLPYWKDITSLSGRQAATAADGSFTFIIAPRDPGYVNWLSTAGLNDGIMSLRLENIPAGVSVDPGKAIRSSVVVKLADVADQLSAGATQVTPEERDRDREARAAAYAKRRIE